MGEIARFTVVSFYLLSRDNFARSRLKGNYFCFGIGNVSIRDFPHYEHASPKITLDESALQYGNRSLCKDKTAVLGLTGN